jgi:hypothetical protein
MREGADFTDGLFAVYEVAKENVGVAFGQSVDNECIQRIRLGLKQLEDLLRLRQVEP